MNELDLEAIKKRCESATPGPWGVRLSDPGILSGVFYSGKEEIFTPGTKLPKSICRNPQFSQNQDIRSDMEFIAHARTDIPVLIEEVERLRTDRNILITALEAFKRYARHKPGKEVEFFRFVARNARDNSVFLCMETEVFDTIADALEALKELNDKKLCKNCLYWGDPNRDTNTSKCLVNPPVVLQEPICR